MKEGMESEMKNTTIKREFEKLAAGATTWSMFVAETHDEWSALGASLMKAYRGSRRLPAGVELEDVVQELLLHAWKFSQKWDPEGGQTLERYAVVGACYRARDWMDSQRRSLRRSSTNPSRFPTPVSETTAGKTLARACPGIGEVDVIDALSHREAEQEEAAMWREAADRLVSEAGDDAAPLAALFEAFGCVESAGRVLYRDDARRYRDEKEAARHVRRAAKTAATVAA